VTVDVSRTEDEGRRFSAAASEQGLAATRLVTDDSGARLYRRRFGLHVLEGPDRGARATSAQRVTTVGTAAQNALVLTDPTVSRFHLRVDITPRGFRLTDLDSTNGSWLGHLRLAEGMVNGSNIVDLRLGTTLVRFLPLGEEERFPLHNEGHFGALTGKSPTMRELFDKLARVAPQRATVLIEGPTGTGKELIAAELHRHSGRRGQPFVVVDCGAIPSALIESELFGHLQGAFTGATASRPGAFEEANGGTIFLDEIGELDLSMQPRLLRVIESGEVKRVGENRYRKINVRIAAATCRDLQRAVNQGSFRADLFYRLAVVHLRVPPLRERPDDIEALVEHLLPTLAQQHGRPVEALSRSTIQQLCAHPWPGNVRELRNFLERLVVLGDNGSSTSPEMDLASASSADNACKHPMVRPFHQAKAELLAEFEVDYLKSLLDACQHNVAEASRRSGIGRSHLFRLISKYKLR